MNDASSPPEGGKSGPDRTEPPVLHSRDLLAGRREVVIQHGDERYRLRLTSNSKLILVK